MKTNINNKLADRNEHGEGVISLAIGVLIMAALGVAMWAAFNGTMTKAQTTVDNEVSSIHN